MLINPNHSALESFKLGFIFFINFSYHCKFNTPFLLGVYAPKCFSRLPCARKINVQVTLGQTDEKPPKAQEGEKEHFKGQGRWCQVKNLLIRLQAKDL